MMTVSDLMEILAEIEDPHTEVWFSADDYGEIQLAEGFICTDGTLMLVPPDDSFGEEEDALYAEETGDDVLPDDIAAACFGCEQHPEKEGKNELFEAA